jgi:hypothetical protein
MTCESIFAGVIQWQNVSFPSRIIHISWLQNDLELVLNCSKGVQKCFRTVLGLVLAKLFWTRIVFEVVVAQFLHN